MQARRRAMCCMIACQPPAAPAPAPAMFIRALSFTLPLLFCLSAAAQNSGQDSDAAPGLAGLAPAEQPVMKPEQADAIKLISYLINKSHYRTRPLDDGFSEGVLQAYLEALDPGKNVFLQSDIDGFENLRHQFDDYIRDGRLGPVFGMFDILRIRIDQRVEYALARLEQPFDFARDEEFLFDRSEAGWARDAAELDAIWRRRIKNDILNLRQSGKEEDAIRETLARRYTHLARRTRHFKSEDVFQTFVNAYLRRIDPHTTYFSPRASENFQIHMRLSLEGIGAVLQSDNEYTQVRRIIPGGPADIAGELQAEDRIVGVAQEDGEMVDVIGWRMDDVVALIRGPKGSLVRLEVLPGEGAPDSPTRVLSVRRDKISLDEQAAKKRTLEIDLPQGKADIGVIDLPSFYIDFAGQHQKLPNYRSTTRDVRKLLAEFDEEGIDGLIIDLRGNGGGALSEAVALTGLFIDRGPVVQVHNAGGRTHVDRDPDPGIVYRGPLAVLVDSGSASASEIFAGAIQDYGRGLVIGEPTFGKGTVQHLVSLDRFAKSGASLGQLKVTIAQFFRVNGDSTQHRGVIPDFIWPTAGDDAESGERAYETAIAWRRIAPAAFARHAESPAPDALAHVRALHEARVEESPEFRYWRDAAKMDEERRDIKSVALHEKKRKREREAREARELELENRMRRALGKKTAASHKALTEENEAQDRAAENDRLAFEPDAFLRESGRILSDYLHALGGRLASVGRDGAQAGE